MSEFTPPVTRKERERVEKVQLVIQAMTKPVIEGTDLAQLQFDLTLGERD